MAEILKRNKALAVNPLKASQPIGASLAFLGINRAIPMMHGSQGCTAFGKVFFVRHFREPNRLAKVAHEKYFAECRAALRTMHHRNGAVDAEKGQRSADRLTGFERIHREGFVAFQDFG